MAPKMIYTGIRVKDMEESIRLYAGLLGMQLLERKKTPETSGEWATLKSPGSEQIVELNRYEEGSRFGTSYKGGSELDHLGFDVEDLTGWVLELEEEGATILVRPREIGGWNEAFIEGPNGIWVEFLQRAVPDSEPARFERIASEGVLSLAGVQGCMSLKLGSLRITSPAFGNSERMAKKYAGDGGNVSPPLEWSWAPKGTKEFALICHDPDAPLPHGFTHWVLYGIPAGVTKLSEGQKQDAFTSGVNDAGQRGYMGPYPPNGHGTHHYYFWVYALGDELRLKPGLNRAQLLEAISGHILEQARTVGTYER